MKGSKHRFELAGNSSYRGFELSGFNCIDLYLEHLFVVFIPQTEKGTRKTLAKTFPCPVHRQLLNTARRPLVIKAPNKLQQANVGFVGKNLFHQSC